MQKKYKILIHVSLMRRDIGMAYVLSRIFEHLGCECHITGANTYTRRVTVLWNPDAIIYGTIGRTEDLRRLYPQTKLFLYPGEGGESYKYSAEKNIAEFKHLFDSIERVYLWGNHTKNHILNRVDELKEQSFLHGRKELLDDKCLIAGHPRLDLIRYYPQKSRKNDPRISVGLIGFFNLPNNIRQRSIISTVLRDNANWEELLFQTHLLTCYTRIIDSLDKNRYKISLRPYPLENLDSYPDAEWVKNKTIDINKSLEFGTWALDQDLIIGPTSSTLVQIALAKRPFINVDTLNSRSTVAYKESIRDVFVKNVQRHCPSTFEELHQMIENYQKLQLAGDDFDELMNDIYTCRKKESSLYKVASDVLRILEQKPANKSKIPKHVMATAHNFIYKGNPMRYGDISYASIKKQLQNELNSTVENLLKDCRIN